MATCDQARQGGRERVCFARATPSRKGDAEGAVYRDTINTKLRIKNAE